MKHKGWLDGVGYWRYSSDAQDAKSIAQQKTSMRPKAQAERVNLLKEFEDAAISGANTAKRDDFHRMVEFCQERQKQGKPIRVLVIFNTSRLSRADSHETGHYIHLLRQAGVRWVLTHERWYDFDKDEDRIVFNLEQDISNHRFLKTLAQQVLRGKKDRAQAGYACGGPANFGFDKLVINERGEVVARIKRGEPNAYRSKGWHVEHSPIPADDPDPSRQLERKAVLWIFDWLVNQNWPYRKMARELQRRGVPPPLNRRKNGKSVWTDQAIKAMVTKPIYAGLNRYGHEQSGKFYTLQDGELTQVGDDVTGGSTAIMAVIPRGGYVSREVWEAACQVVERRKVDNDKCRRREQGYPLSAGGLVKCGMCGSDMQGQCLTRKTATGERSYPRYLCQGKNSLKAKCESYAIDEAQLVKTVTDVVLNQYLCPEFLEMVREEMLAAVESRHTPDAGRLDAAKAEVVALQDELKKYTRAWMKIQDDDNEAAVAMTKELMDESARNLKAAQARLKEVEHDQAVPAHLVREHVEGAMAAFDYLRQRLQTATTREVYDFLLRQVVTEVRVYFRSEQGEKKKRHFVTRIEVDCLPQQAFGPVSHLTAKVELIREARPDEESLGLQHCQDLRYDKPKHPVRTFVATLHTKDNPDLVCNS
jgi:hypothetical protein